VDSIDKYIDELREDLFNQLERARQISKEPNPEGFKGLWTGLIEGTPDIKVSTTLEETKDKLKDLGVDCG